MSSDDRIIIASAHLPIEVDKQSDGEYAIRVTDESLIYSILYGIKEKEICEVVWVGMLKNYTQYSEQELNKINDFLKDNNIYMIMVNDLAYKNYWIYINHIISPVFTDSAIDIQK
jgi:trehalose-6-phosphate synthase